MAGNVENQSISADPNQHLYMLRWKEKLDFHHLTILLHPSTGLDVAIGEGTTEKGAGEVQVAEPRRAPVWRCISESCVVAATFTLIFALQWGLKVLHS